jgi:hypothetical protein
MWRGLAAWWSVVGGLLLGRILTEYLYSAPESSSPNNQPPTTNNYRAFE